MKILMFSVYGEAQPQGSTKAFIPKGWSRPVLTSTNPKLKSWRQLVAESANVALARLDKADRTLLLDGVRLTIAFYLPRPISLAKRVTAHTKKPDIDKLLRAVCDALSGVVFRDDSQICELVAVKHYAAAGALPRVDLTVEGTAGLVALRREQPLFEEARTW